MNVAIVTGRRPLAFALLLSAVCLGIGLAGGLAACHRTPDAAGQPPAADAQEKPAAEKPAAAEDAADGVSLKPEEVKRMGIVTTAAVAAMHTPETAGFGTVVAHETIAQAVADVETAAAVERQSRAALDRGKRLAGTPGAMPVETQEGAQRQAVVDQAALELAKRRLSSTFGLNPPWKTRFDAPELSALASGKNQLVRVTFPLGALGAGDPSSLRFMPLNAAAGGKSWKSTVVWRAPADAGVPGKSFFAVLTSSDAGEGERLMARAPAGDPDSGVELPASAAVISAGKYWCYIEQKPGLFVRTEIDTGMPTDTGYFVKEGVSPGDKVVTTSAGELLARETNPSKAAD